MPLVRARVAARLGAPIAEGLDPMTLVAQGAALYAATAGLDGRAAAQTRADRPPGVAAVPGGVVGSHAARRRPVRRRGAAGDGASSCATTARGRAPTATVGPDGDVR